MSVSYSSCQCLPIRILNEMQLASQIASMLPHRPLQMLLHANERHWAFKVPCWVWWIFRTLKYHVWHVSWSTDSFNPVSQVPFYLFLTRYYANISRSGKQELTWKESCMRLKLNYFNFKFLYLSGLPIEYLLFPKIFTFLK